ncbi:MAG: cytochrome c biogenesis protein ResB [Candidatus Bipolaricaulia bacterium]
MFCPNCGTEVQAEGNFCHACGTALPDTEASAASSPPETPSEHPVQSDAADPSVVSGADAQPLSFSTKVERVRQELAGLNCGRCGYEDCADNAEAIVRGESPYDSCLQAAPEAKERIRELVGMPEQRSQIAQLWRGLASVKLAIGLIVVLTVLSIIGTLIPQGQSQTAYVGQYGETGYQVISFFQLDGLFHSWFYLGLLGLLGLNTTACLSRRFRTSLRMLKRQPGGQTADSLLKLENSAEVPISGGPIKALDRAAESLREKGYKVKREGANLMASKQRFGRLGVDVFHASLVLLLVGALVGGLFGFEAFQQANKGEVFDVPNADFQVRVDDLWTETYEDGKIKDWYSQLTVIEDGQEVKTKTIQVNDPMTYEGINFYQTSFGSDWMGGAEVTFAVQKVASTSQSPSPEDSDSQDSSNAGDTSNAVGVTTASAQQNPHGDTSQDAQGSQGSQQSPHGGGSDYEVVETLRETTVTQGKRFQLTAELTAEFVRFYPDIMFTKNGPQNRSRRLNNPAAEMRVYRGEELMFHGYTFARFPDMQIWIPNTGNANSGSSQQPAMTQGRLGEQPFRIDIVGMSAPQFTGLQVSSNPGIGIIYASFVVMVIGIVLNFYMPPRWVWAVSERGRLVIGGVGRDNREFMGEFDTLLERVQEDLSAASQTPRSDSDAPEATPGEAAS